MRNMITLKNRNLKKKIMKDRISIKFSEKACLSFLRKHLDDPQDFWENALWTHETKDELVGKCVICPITSGIKK